MFPTLLYSAEPFTLCHRYIRKQTFPSASPASTTNPPDNIPNVEVLTQANVASTEATLLVS